ncbi:MAG: DNA topoisomerase IV [Bacteroidota bacterium]
MKLIISRVSLFAGLLALLTGCSEIPERNCSQYTTGTYASYAVIDGDSVATTFVRNDSLEIESFLGKRDTSTVRWINNCEYILKKLDPKNRAEEKSIHIKILTTTDSSYTFEFNAVGSTKKLRATAFKKH